MLYVNLKKRFSAMMAAVLVLSCMVAPAAFADAAIYDSTITDAGDIPALPTAAATPDTTRPTAAATRAAMPLVEILGLQGVEESGQLISLEPVKHKGLLK